MLPIFIIDFDSTIVTIETLDELAAIALTKNVRKREILDEVREITKLGMEGKFTFPESLAKRLQLFSANRSHIQELIQLLRSSITPSLLRNDVFPKKFAQHIYIISGGFKEYIIPIVKELGIDESHVLANTFVFDKRGKIVGFDEENPLATENGKSKIIKQLQLKGEVIVVGDGFTDYQIKEQGIATRFYAFTENVRREQVTAKADKVIENFDEFLYYNDMPRKLSYPKSKIQVLLVENIHPKAAELFTKEGYKVLQEPKALSEDELIEKIKDISIIGIGSRTQITENVLKHAPKLLAVARFGIGVNNIDLKSCSNHGVAVFNAPYSNTRSVVEMVIGEIVMLARRIVEKNEKMQKGIWDKTSKDCHEIRGKKLGIIGYGNIGFQLGVLAETLGMEVYYYDIIEKLAVGNATPCKSLKELLKIADVITLHVDGRKENTNLLGEKEFALMKPGVILVNSSRGHVVDINALKKYMINGKVHGAAIDVFPREPKSNSDPFVSELQGLPNVILSPHVGGRSEEAQEHMGRFVPEKVINFINTGTTVLSVNFPNLLLSAQDNVHRIIHIHKNIPGVLADINNVFAKYKINIEGQYLKTNEFIGYVITDVNSASKDSLVKELRDINGTIRVRVLY